MAMIPQEHYAAFVWLPNHKITRGLLVKEDHVYYICVVKGNTALFCSRHRTSLIFNRYEITNVIILIYVMDAMYCDILYELYMYLEVGMTHFYCLDLFNLVLGLT